MPTTIEALIVIALVVSPGYIFARFARDVIALSRDSGDFRFLLPAITCGTLIHILMSFWTVRIVGYYRETTVEYHLVEFLGWGLATGFIVPILLGIGISQIAKRPIVDDFLDRIGMGYVDRLPTAWEFAVRIDRSPYVRVHLRDQATPIGGLFGRGSFASTTPNRADLFIEEVVPLDAYGNFTGERYPDTWGAWISHDVISHVEFFEGAQEEMRDELDSNN